MTYVVTVAFTLGLILAVALTAHLASGTKGNLGAWLAGVVVFAALVLCASVSPKTAGCSVLVTVAVFRFARWLRDQDALGARATTLYRLL